MLEISSKTKWTILDLGVPLIGWNEAAAGLLHLNLESKGIIGYPARFLAVIGEFTNDQIYAALGLTAQCPTPSFSVWHFSGDKAKLEAQLASLPPANEMEIKADTPPDEASEAVERHGR